MAIVVGDILGAAQALTATRNLFMPARDEVAVLDQDGYQVFSRARPIKATVNERAKVMEHPVESGATITDHKIIEPVEITLSMILDPMLYRSTYAQIKSYFKSGTLFTVLTKSGGYPDMLITAIPHDEDPAISDTITMALSLKQVIIVEAQYGTLPPQAVESASDTDTVKRGEVTAKDVPTDSATETNSQSVLSDWTGRR